MNDLSKLQDQYINDEFAFDQCVPSIISGLINADTHVVFTVLSIHGHHHIEDIHILLLAHGFKQFGTQVLTFGFGFNEW